MIKCAQGHNLFPRRAVAGICAHLLPEWLESARSLHLFTEVGHSSEIYVWAAYLPAFSWSALLQAIPQCPVSSPRAALTKPTPQSPSPTLGGYWQGETSCLLCCKCAVRAATTHTFIYIHKTQSHLSTQCVACKMTACVQKGHVVKVSHDHVTIQVYAPALDANRELLKCSVCSQCHWLEFLFMWIGCESPCCCLTSWSGLE